MARSRPAQTRIELAAPPRIFRIADGQKVAEETIRSGDVARAVSLSKQIGAALTRTPVAPTSSPLGQARYAYEGAARENIKEFTTHLTTRELTDPSAPP